MALTRVWILLCAIAGASASSAEARDWKKIVIPSAKCANGSQYWVFLSKKDPTRVALNIQGGGACWSRGSCYGLIHTAANKAVQSVFDIQGWASGSDRQSPVSDHTMVYFPYCTGDAHVGDHIANYKGRKTYHWGKRNFEASVDYLVSNGHLSLAQAKQVVLYGNSAGALGALFNVRFLDRYLNSSQDKVLVADSPGLHFGSNFWDKFTDQQMKDYSAAMTSLGLELNPKSGNIARIIPTLCESLPDWRVSVLQGARDLVMSILFGAQLPRSEDRRIFSSTGLWSLLEKGSYENCSAWIPDTFMHVFFKVRPAATWIRAERKSAFSFASDVVNARNLGQSYRD